jgi:hypothetical protein
LTPLCIASLTFMAEPPFLEFQVHLIQCSAAPFSQPYNRSGATAPAPQGRRRKDHSYAIRPDKRRRCRCHLPEHLTATSRPGSPPNIAKSTGLRAFDAKPGLSILGSTKACVRRQRNEFCVRKSGCKSAGRNTTQTSRSSSQSGTRAPLPIDRPLDGSGANGDHS